MVMRLQLYLAVADKASQCIGTREANTGLPNSLLDLHEV